MSLLDLIKKIEDIAKSQQGVHSVFRGDIYDNWNKPDVQYISVNVAITNYTQHIIDAYDEYEVYLYCGDRLLQDNSNEYEVLTNTQRVLVNIISILDSYEKIDVVDEVQYVNFVQSFADYVAGEYVRFNVRVPLDVNNCDLVLDEPIELTINKNGIYELNGNYRVTVAVPQCEEVIRELQTQIDTLETEKAELQENLNTALNQIDVDNNTISELQAAIEEKNALINDLNNTIANLRNEISDKNTEITNLQTQITELNSEKSDLQNRLTEALNNIETLNTTIDNLQAAIEAKNALIEELQTTIANLRNEIATKQTEIERLNGELDAINASINAERSTSIVENGTYESQDKLGWNKVVVNVSTGSDCEEVIRNLQAEIDRLENEVATKNAEITNLESQISTLNSEKQTLQNSLTEAQNTIQTLNNTITELNVVIEAKSEDINNLSAQIATLQGELDALKADINATRTVTYTENGNYTTENKLGYNVINVNVPTLGYVEMTQAEYDALSVKDSNTFYGILPN